VWFDNSMTTRDRPERRCGFHLAGSSSSTGLLQKARRSSLCSLGVSLCLCGGVLELKSGHHRDTKNTEVAQRNPHRSNFRTKAVALLLASLLMTSCSRAPSFDILGSYFPAWLICLALGVVLTAAIRWLLLRFQIGVVFPIVVYPSLTALVAFGMWLVFYS